ncbi:MAG: hypothetical protein RLY97_1181 [Pseudomonadota bacterium]
MTLVVLYLSLGLSCAFLTGRAIVYFAVNNYKITKNQNFSPFKNQTSELNNFPFSARRGLTPSAMSSAISTGKYVGIAEIHKFGLLRRQMGCQKSDALMALIANQFEHQLPNSTIGRVGRKSIEFAFAADDDQAAEEQLLQIGHWVENDVVMDDCRLSLLTHIGAVQVANGDVDNEVLHRAETALSEAQTLSHRVVIAQAVGVKANELSPLTLIRDLHEAMAQGHLQLHYQPKLHNRSNSISTMEALLRWQHPEHGMMNTQQLIEIAEATGAIREVTRWVIQKAVADQLWLESQGHAVALDVNISGPLLVNSEFATWAIQHMTQTQHPMGIEITETAVIEDPASAINNLNLFADAGIRIAIDDYGSGLSSLVYLKQLPADELKIDRHFVSGLTESHRDPLIIRSTIDLAHALDMQVTAEGVDDAMALSLLRVMGCDMIQGYVVCKPLPLAECEIFLKSFASDESTADESRNFAGWQV